MSHMDQGTSVTHTYIRELVGWLAKLVAVDQALPSASTLSVLALDVARQVHMCKYV